MIKSGRGANTDLESRRDRFDNLPPVDPWEAFEERGPGWTERLLMPGLFALAWLLFELTAIATLSVLVACLRFGWEDYRTAIWLRRVDPLTARAKTGFWFYLASGVWKTALMPVLAVMILSVGWGLLAPRAVRMDKAAAEQVISALMVGAAASGVLVLVVAVGVFHALLGNVKIWVHPELHRSRRTNVWPPEWIRPVWQHDNRARAILATALIAVTIGAPIFLYRTVVQFEALSEVFAVLLLVFGTPIAAAFTYAALRSRIFAHRPGQCWPESVDQSQAQINPAVENAGLLHAEHPIAAEMRANLPA